MYVCIYAYIHKHPVVACVTHCTTQDMHVCCIHTCIHALHAYIHTNPNMIIANAKHSRACTHAHTRVYALFYPI